LLIHFFSFISAFCFVNFAGTTTAEVKSGYGLDLDTELKMLLAVEDARSRSHVELSSTYCGAHAVPE
jgi:imidazolonepropionase